MVKIPKINHNVAFHSYISISKSEDTRQGYAPNKAYPYDNSLALWVLQDIWMSQRKEGKKFLKGTKEKEW